VIFNGGRKKDKQKDPNCLANQIPAGKKVLADSEGIQEGINQKGWKLTQDEALQSKGTRQARNSFQEVQGLWNFEAAVSAWFRASQDGT